MLKIHTDTLKKNNWSINIDLQDARKQGLIVELAESTCIRMIEKIAGVDRDGVRARLKQINGRMKQLKKAERSKSVSMEVQSLIRERMELQYLPEYVCLVCGNETDFNRARQGFYINGRKYLRLVGTSNGIKKSTVVFVSELARNDVPLIDDLRRRIDNGRDMMKGFIPAKLEAYRALVCSATAPLSSPAGVLVVNDCVTHFKSDYIRLSDDPDGGEPLYEIVRDGNVELDESDGYGMMSPGLAARWQKDLKLDYLPAGVCLRNSFCKGMIFTFNFHEFADAIAGKYTVKDVWGNEHDIRDIELVLTTSMLKLADSYKSVEDYLENCEKNGYCWGATKVTPKELDHERMCNYQFLQSFDLSDDELWDLISPTLFGISDAMGGDYYKSLLFLRGTEVDENLAIPEELDWVAALSADKRLLNDPYIRQKIKNLIKKKIKSAKIGEIKVKGNFSVVCGDPYALCQSMFGLPVTGLLKAGQIYNRYWADAKAPNVACFRAPMSTHNNVRRMGVARGWNADHWYQYMPTVTLVNAWDMLCAALNGMDKTLSPVSVMIQ